MAPWAGCRLSDRRNRKASGSSISEALLLFASLDNMLYDDKLSLLSRFYEQHINEVR